MPSIGQFFIMCSMHWTICTISVLFVYFWQFGLPAKCSVHNQQTTMHIRGRMMPKWSPKPTVSPSYIFRNIKYRYFHWEKKDVYSDLRGHQRLPTARADNKYYYWQVGPIFPVTYDRRTWLTSRNSDDWQSGVGENSVLSRLATRGQHPPAPQSLEFDQPQTLSRPRNTWEKYSAILAFFRHRYGGRFPE
jgi:hypothetical protein